MYGIFLAMTASAGPSAPSGPSAPDASQLAWLAGCWRTESGSEECWMAPRGGLMLGLGRSVREGRPAFWEQLRIEAVDGVLTYVATPKGQATTAFALAELGPHTVTFANPEHDFPQRITYRREGEVLTATIEGVRQGEPASASFTFERAADWPGR